MITLGLLALAGAYATFHRFYRRARAKQAALIVKHYAGSLSLTGDTVRFQYRGATFELRRIASGGGLGGTGSYAGLVLVLADGTPLVITPPGAAKYVYAFSIPAEHSALTSPATGLLIAGPEHEKAAAALARSASSDAVSRLFCSPFSTLRVQRTIRVTWRRPICRAWTLQLTGIPEQIYRQPESLQPLLDDVMEVAKTLGLRMT